MLPQGTFTLATANNRDRRWTCPRSVLCKNHIHWLIPLTLCSMLHALCSMLYALCSMLCTYRAFSALALLLVFHILTFQVFENTSDWICFALPFHLVSWIVRRYQRAISRLHINLTVQSGGYIHLSNNISMQWRLFLENLSAHQLHFYDSVWNDFPSMSPCMCEFVCHRFCHSLLRRPFLTNIEKGLQSRRNWHSCCACDSQSCQRERVVRYQELGSCAWLENRAEIEAIHG